MRILKILGGNDYGGQYTCECQFIEYWVAQGVEVDAYILGDGVAVEKYKSIVSNFKVLPELNAKFGGSLKTVVSGIFQSIRYANANRNEYSFSGNYDAIIYRSQTYMHLAALLSKELGTQAYWHLPNSVNKIFSKLYFNVFLRLLNIEPVANSNFTKQSLGRICRSIIYPGYKQSRVVSTSPVFRKRFRIENDDIVFGIAARIHPTKAQDVIIDAFISANLHKKNAYLLIAGYPADEEYFERCKNLAKNYTSNILFLGNVEEMADFYSSIDIYINSRRDAEPFGISIAEAMGAGKPVIAYYKGGPSEMIEPNKSGWLVYESTKKEYKEALLTAVMHLKQIQEMGRYAKDNSVKFSSSLNAENFLKLVKSENNITT